MSANPIARLIAAPIIVLAAHASMALADMTDPDPTLALMEQARETVRLERGGVVDRPSAPLPGGAFCGSINPESPAGIVPVFTHPANYNSGTVHYFFDEDIEPLERLAVLAAFVEIGSYCDLTFEFWTPDAPFTGRRLYITRSPEATVSYGDTNNNGFAVMFIADAHWDNRALIQHEFLHTAGFAHEHQRWDRISFIDYRPENVEPGRENQFDHAWSGIGPYDYASIMHYGATAFVAPGCFGDCRTLVPLTECDTTIGNTDALSPGDIEDLRFAFHGDQRANDAWQDAYEMATCNASVQFDTSDATTQIVNGLPCGLVWNELWYAFEPEADGYIDLTWDSSGGPSALNVRAASNDPEAPAGPLLVRACDVNGGDLTFPVREGDRYYVSIGEGQPAGQPVGVSFPIDGFFRYEFSAGTSIDLEALAAAWFSGDVLPLFVSPGDDLRLEALIVNGGPHDPIAAVRVDWWIAPQTGRVPQSMPPNALVLGSSFLNFSSTEPGVERILDTEIELPAIDDEGMRLAGAYYFGATVSVPDDTDSDATNNTIVASEIMTIEQPCLVDYAPPAGALDIADVVAFLQLFEQGDAAADLAPPAGVFDIADVIAFLNAFGAGCP